MHCSLIWLIVILFIASDTMVKHLQSADACRSFSEFRQEASMLHSLQHPCIVSLVGISIRPLCFALQLAPLGSLNTILEERHKGKGTYRDLYPLISRFNVYIHVSETWSYFFFVFLDSRYMPLGHMLTFKVAYQIAAGLAYLHRKSIIFCDLKSDNILVWSLEVCTSITISKPFIFLISQSPCIKTKTGIQNVYVRENWHIWAKTIFFFMKKQICFYNSTQLCLLPGKRSSQH